MQITAGDGPGPSLLPVPGLCFISHTRLPREQVSLRSPSAVCEFCTWHREVGKLCPLPCPWGLPLGGAGGCASRMCQGVPAAQDVPVAQDVPAGCASSPGHAQRDSALAPGKAKLPSASATWGANFKTFIVLYDLV